MNKKDLIRALRSVDQEGAEELVTKYQGITDSEHERIIQRIEERVRTQTPTESHPQAALPVMQAHRFTWVRTAAMTAACIAVFGGTFAGLFWMKAHTPIQLEYPTLTSVPDERIPVTLAHAVGECYAVPHLTSQGELLIAVQSAGFAEETGLYEVTLELTSVDARSLNDTEVFYADNFLVATGRENGIWKTVSPCAIDGTDAADLPYTIRIGSHHSLTVTLSYALDGKMPLAFVTSSRTNRPYTKFMEESHEKE